MSMIFESDSFRIFDEFENNELSLASYGANLVRVRVTVSGIVGAECGILG
jgi:hypothetical protein